MKPNLVTELVTSLMEENNALRARENRMKMTIPKPATMDQEVIALCAAVNRLPGIRTVESCCGHGKSPYHIWLRARGLRYLPRLVYWFMACHCGFSEWRVIVKTDCGRSPVTFLIEGPVGEDAYAQSIEIARLMKEE